MQTKSEASIENAGMEGRPAGEERRMLERIAAGERRALGELYSRLGRELFRYLLTLCPDRQLAEEVLQDTLVAIWRGAGSYKGRSSARAWIFGVARRRAYSALRRRKLPLSDESALESVAATEPGPEEVALAASRRESLSALVDGLAGAHREALVLVFFQGLSYEETAGILGVPVGTVKSRLSNAKRALRKLHDPQGEGDG